MKSQAYVILLIVVIIIVSVFAVTNVASVEVNYFFWTGKSPLILVILFSVLMGGVITASAGSVRFYQMRRKIKQLNKNNEQMKEILKNHQLLDDLEIDTKKGTKHDFDLNKNGEKYPMPCT